MKIQLTLTCTQVLEFNPELYPSGVRDTPEACMKAELKMIEAYPEDFLANNPKLIKVYGRLLPELSTQTPR